MECKNCGSPTEPILSECQYCGSPIRGVDLTSIPTEDIIRYTNKWIGIMENLPANGMTTRANDNPQHMFDTMTPILRDEINSNVKEYLSLLDIRADKDALANRKFSQLKQDYKDAVDNFEKRRKRVIRYFIIGCSVPIICLIIMIILENMGIV
jgi:hypothetical protein